MNTLTLLLEVGYVSPWFAMRLCMEVACVRPMSLHDGQGDRFKRLSYPHFSEEVCALQEYGDAMITLRFSEAPYFSPRECLILCLDESDPLPEPDQSSAPFLELWNNKARRCVLTADSFLSGSYPPPAPMVEEGAGRGREMSR